MTEQINNNQLAGDFFTEPEVCKILNRHRISIQRYKKAGLLKPVFKIKNRSFYNMESLVELIKLENEAK